MSIVLALAGRCRRRRRRRCSPSSCRWRWWCACGRIRAGEQADGRERVRGWALGDMAFRHCDAGQASVHGCSGRCAGGRGRRPMRRTALVSTGPVLGPRDARQPAHCPIRNIWLCLLPAEKGSVEVSCHRCTQSAHVGATPSPAVDQPRWRSRSAGVPEGRQRPVEAMDVLAQQVRDRHVRPQPLTHLLGQICQGRAAVEQQRVTDQTRGSHGTVNLRKLSCGTGMVGPGGSVCVACVRPLWRCR
jgi:hypothetical protein